MRGSPDEVAIETDFAPADLTDSRRPFDWQTGYNDRQARRKIHAEAFYLVSLLVVTSIISGVLHFARPSVLDPRLFTIARDYIYSGLGGAFGGALFAMKWLYHSVAKGIWHEDRQLWRVFAPVLSAGLAFAFALLARSGLINVFDPESIHGSAAWGIGFLIGYFSDTAIGKLTEVAETLFGAARQDPHHTGRASRDRS